MKKILFGTIAIIMLICVFFVKNPEREEITRKQDRTEYQLLENTNDSDEFCQLVEEKIDKVKLVEESDLIFTGKVQHKIGNYLYKDGVVEANISIYAVKIKEKIYGSDVADEIYFNYGGTCLPEGINMGEDYMFCMVKSGLKLNGKDVYCFESIQQGVFEISRNRIINFIGEDFVKKDFIDYIREQKEVRLL